MKWTRRFFYVCLALSAAILVALAADTIPGWVPSVAAVSMLVALFLVEIAERRYG
jgi:hypothetical protein